MKTISVAVVFNWRNDTNQSGLYSVHVRIRLGIDARYLKVPLAQKVRKDQWLGKDHQWIKATHPYAFQINNAIIEMKGKIAGYVKECLNFNKPVTLLGIVEHMINKGDSKSFLDFMEKYILRPPEKLEINTIKKYRTALSHLRQFRSKLTFPELNNALLQNFCLYMQTDLKLAGAATKKYLEAVKKVIRLARKKDLISRDQMEFMFDDLKVRVPKAKRTFLEVYEIKKLKSLQFVREQKHLERTRDLFLLQIYTGYYYKDLFVFTKDQLRYDEEYGAIILGARDKNGNQTIVPIFKFPHASAIIDMYKSSPAEKTVIAKHHLVEEAVYNRQLKEIGKLAGINKNITNKVARHTNGQLWTRFGAQGAILSKMMGHTKEQTTRNYFDVNIPEIVEGTKHADFATMGI